MVADLHLHTTASDGTYTPQQIVKRAKALGFKAIAITDHDTIDGVFPAQKAGKELELEVIPGIELSTDLEGTEIHLLAYLFDLDNLNFLAILEKLKAARFERVVHIVDKLRRLGLTITSERVFELAGDGTVGRPHVARALLEKGYVGSIRQAFEKYIGSDRPAYVDRFKITPLEAIKLIRNAKGIPVLAHPGLIDQDDLIEKLAGEGLMGVEAYHSDHSPAKGKHYAQLAQRHGLLITGGSDCHGPTIKSGDLIGKIRLPYYHLTKLKEAKDILETQN